MPIDIDEREQCSVPECECGVWFTVEKLCRVHGIEVGADVEPLAIEQTALVVEVPDVPVKKASSATKVEGES